MGRSLTHSLDFLRTFEALFSRLRQNPKPWTQEHTNIVKLVKEHVKSFLSLGILNSDAFPIIEIDASNIGYGGILKQDFQNHFSIVRFHSGMWSGTQENYSTIKKEILAIVLCIQKFQEYVFNKKFIFHVDCKSAKEILQKDVQNIVSKQIFSKWQAILSLFFIVKLNLPKVIQTLFLIFFIT